MATSSAEPEKLFRYSDVGLALNSEVKSELARLRGSLAHFESVCREPGFRLGVMHHADSLGSYSSECETVDSWVRCVGAGFQAADSGGFGAILLQVARWQPWHVPVAAAAWLASSIFPSPSWLNDAVKDFLGVGVQGEQAPAPSLPPTAEGRARAEDVPAGIGEDGLYSRNGYEDRHGVSPTSNCTWYAAAAVKQASGGKIDLNDIESDWRHYPPMEGGYGLGPATEWAARAKHYAVINPNGLILGVDQSPRVGDVYWSNTGHVAYVEEVRLLQDGKTWEVVVSEENALNSGAPISASSVRVTVTDDANGVVKRYRRTIPLEVEPGSQPPKIKDDAVQFIHFRYDIK